MVPRIWQRSHGARWPWLAGIGDGFGTMRPTTAQGKPH